MYTLYVANKNYSSWSLRGWLAMMLSRAPFTEVMVSLSGTGMPNPANLAFSPTARSACAEMHSGFSQLRNDMTMCIRERVDVRPWSSGLERDIARVIEIWNEGRRRYGQGGPYLCGAFSLSDAFYAPVAYRFRTYSVAPDGAAGGYLQALLAHPFLRQWEDAALLETEIIDADEPRLIYRDKLAAKVGANA